VNKIWHVNIVALLIAILPLPYAFYPGLRGLVCGSALYLLFQMHSKKIAKTNNWLILFAGMAILYNPLFPVFLPKSAWVVINLATAYIFYRHIQDAGHGAVGNQEDGEPSKNQTTHHKPKAYDVNMEAHMLRFRTQSSDAEDYFSVLDKTFDEFEPKNFSHVKFGSRQTINEMAATAAQLTAVIAAKNCFENRVVNERKDLVPIMIFAFAACKYFCLMSHGNDDDFDKVSDAVMGYFECMNIPDLIKSQNLKNLGDQSYIWDCREQAERAYSMCSSREPESNSALDLFTSHISAFVADREEKHLYIVRKYLEEGGLEGQTFSDNKDQDIDELAVDEAVEYILALLLPQHLLMGVSPSNLPSDDFSIGYVFGFVDENLRNRGISNEDVRAYAIATIVFGSLFGEERGGELFGRVLELNADRSSEVVVGAQQGVNDIRIFQNSDDQGQDGPMGWAAKIKGIDDKRNMENSCEFPF
jgi:hypothetical protein